MAIVPIDNAHLTQSLLNDAMQMRTFVQWIEARYSVYNQNCSTANMTAAGISSGDQTTVLAFIADLSRINTLLVALSRQMQQISRMMSTLSWAYCDQC